jgi:hypothetical protein
MELKTEDFLGIKSRVAWSYFNFGNYIISILVGLLYKRTAVSLGFVDIVLQNIFGTRNSFS